MKVKFFSQEGCPLCPAAKVVVDQLKARGIPVEYFDVKTVDGRVEAGYYGLMSTPSLIVTDNSDVEIAAWRGQVPDREKILAIFAGEAAAATSIPPAPEPGCVPSRVKQVKKRDGRVLPFDEEKIVEAIWKAAQSVGGKDRVMAAGLAKEVVRLVNAKFDEKNAPGIEDIQDLVEKVLVENGHFRTAKAFILYRRKRGILRANKAALLNVPVDEVDSNLSVNAIKVLEKRYLLKDTDGNVIETPKQLFRRVARAIALADIFYDRDADLLATEEEFYQLMCGLDFLPNSPTLMNAGTSIGQLSACFVIPVDDAISSIFEAVKQAALIHQSGGGTGFSFSRLRPSGDVVRSTGGVASGPVSFMRVFDTGTDVIKQGGKRRGANMGMLRVDHPDIIKFITCRERNDVFNNFNISVAITDKFMQAVDDGTDYEIYNPRDKGKPSGKMNARSVFNLIVSMAWKNGEPGVVFIDRINQYNPTPHVGAIESTNPCVTGDTLISTENGLERAGTLFESGREVSVVPDGRLSGERTLAASQVFPTGVKEVFRLKTQEGYELRLTADHQVLTERGFVRARELKKGDTLCIQNRKGGFGKGGSLEEGRVFGWLVGDGFISEDKGAVLSFFGEEQQLAPAFAEYVSGMIGGQIGTVQVKGRSETRVSSKRLERMLAHFGLQRNQKVCVPEYLFCASEEMQRGFLQGAFSSDGHVSGTDEKGHSVRLTSISEIFLKDVQRMLLNFGIASKLYCNRHDERVAMLPDGKGGTAAYHCQPDHDLVVSKQNLLRFMQEVGFLSQAKQSKLAAACASFSRGPYEEKFVARFSELVSDGDEPVYDLTEPATHAFIANGIVVHNCGEQPLLPHESCNLGSINLAHMVTPEGEVDWEKLRRVARTAVHFLDNVIDVNKYPLPQIDKMTKANRKIGLGVMGFADLLFTLNIAYNSEEAVKLAEKVMGFIVREGREESQLLAEKRGAFPNFKGSVFDKPGAPPMRNATITTIAPTGTLSILAGCSSGVEPLFAIVFVRRVMDNTELLEVHPIFEEMARAKGFYTPELMREIARTGGLHGAKNVPDEIRRVFVTAHDITPEWHIRIQAAFQKFTDNAVSKTINFSSAATPEDVENVYRLAFKLNCKGVTVYRDGSRENQVLSVKAAPKSPDAARDSAENGSAETAPPAPLGDEPRPSPLPTMIQVAVASAKIDAAAGETTTMASDIAVVDSPLSAPGGPITLASLRDGGTFRKAHSEESGGCTKCEITKD